MSRSAGSTIARACSGSRSSISSIEPLISANSAVTVLRSPSATSESSGCSCATLTLDVGSAVGDEAAEEPAPSVSAAPHLPQKLEVGGFSALHFAQGLVSAVPHWAQKLLTDGLFVPHFEQRIFPPTAFQPSNWSSN